MNIITQHRLNDIGNIIFTFFIAGISVIFCALISNLAWYIITK